MAWTGVRCSEMVWDGRGSSLRVLKCSGRFQMVWAGFGISGEFGRFEHGLELFRVDYGAREWFGVG